MARPTKPESSSVRKVPETKPASSRRVVETKPKKQVKFLIPAESAKPLALPPLRSITSPTHSQSSLPTTLTPSSIRSTIPLHAFSPLRLSRDAIPLVHTLFSSPPGVVLDILRPPHPDFLRVHSDILNQPATNPPARSLSLLSSGLPWVISVQPTTQFTQFVTVFDVLHALHISLHKHVKPREFDTYNKSDKDAISTVWHGRLNQISHESLRVKEYQKGLRRIDFLLGRTRVKGLRLSPTPINGDIAWVVDFGT